MLRVSSELLILISANLAAGRYRTISELIGDTKENRVSPRKIYEIILQSYLFLGYPRAIEGLKLFESKYPRFVPPPGVDPEPAAVNDWRKRGELLCRKIYGSNYEPLRRRIKGISPDLDAWMVWEGYGKVLSRGQVPSYVRELCSCAALVITGDTVQLHSHLRGALHVGARPRMLRAMFELISDIAGKKRMQAAFKVLDEVCGKPVNDA